MASTKYYLDKRTFVNGETGHIGLTNMLNLQDYIKDVLDDEELVLSVETGITAFATGGQASATLLTAFFNDVTVCATAGDSVKLGLAEAGATVVVKNSGAANLAVFPNTSDTINGGSANASVTIIPGGEITFRAINAVNWETEETSFPLGFLQLDSTTMTAGAGGGYANAETITSSFANVQTVATNADSVALPATAVGKIVFVYNGDSTEYMDLFPQPGSTIAGAASFSILPSTMVAVIADSATTWVPLVGERIYNGFGTAANPSYSFLGDPDTGLFSTGAGDVKISIAGGEDFVFSANLFTAAAGSDIVLTEGSVSITDTVDERALLVTSSAATNDAVHIVANSLTTGDGLRIESSGTIADGGSALRIVASGVNTAGLIDGAALDIKAANQTGGVVAQITTAGLTTGNALELTGAAQTTGNIIQATGGGATLATGGAVARLDMGAATAGSGIEVVTTGDYTGTDGVVLVEADTATTGEIVVVSADALTTGTALSIENTGGTLTGAGKLIDCIDGSSVFSVGENGNVRIANQLYMDRYAQTLDFNEAASGQLSAGPWGLAVTYGGTNGDAADVTYTGGQDGAIKLETDGADNDGVCLLWNGFSTLFDSDPVLEFRFKVSVVSDAAANKAAFFVGLASAVWTDKLSIAGDHILVGLNTEGVADHSLATSNSLYISSDNTAAGQQTFDSGETLLANTWCTVRIDMTNNNQPRVWINSTGGVISASDEIAGITGLTTQLGLAVFPVMSVQALDGNVQDIEVDYMKVWQTRGV